MNAITVPSYALVPAAIALSLLTLCLVALTINRSSVRRSLDLSPVSKRTDRSDCAHPGCTIVHPGRGRHRADPRPDGPVTIIVAAFATGFGLITNPKGQHYDHWRLGMRCSCRCKWGI